MTGNTEINGDFIQKLLNHHIVACDILPRFQGDFVGSNLKYLLSKKYISKEDYENVMKGLDENPDLRSIKVAEMVIKHKDKEDIIRGLKDGFDVSLKLIQEYIRQKYPEHYRELFKTDPDTTKLSENDLKKIHRYLNKNFNAGI